MALFETSVQIEVATKLATGWKTDRIISHCLLMSVLIAHHPTSLARRTEERDSVGRVQPSGQAIRPHRHLRIHPLRE